MEKIFFDKKDCKSSQHIKINCYVHNDYFLLCSNETGRRIEFTLNKEISIENALNHEYWDGEESHRLYTSREVPNVICELWWTPYDVRVM
jgi:hypothetical protein